MNKIKIYMIIIFKFEIEINNDELSKIIWEEQMREIKKGRGGDEILLN
jgi:hypothetical protein